MCNLVEKKTQIFNFALDVFNGIIDYPHKNESDKEKSSVMKFTLMELGNREGASENRISLEIHKFVKKTPKFSGKDVKPLSDSAPLPEKKRGNSKFPSSITLEIDGKKFKATASKFRPDTNIFVCIALLAFIAKKSTISVYKILTDKKVKLPISLSQNGHFLHVLLMKHHWDHFDGVKRLQ